MLLSGTHCNLSIPQRDSEVEPEFSGTFYYHNLPVYPFGDRAKSESIKWCIWVNVVGWYLMRTWQAPLTLLRLIATSNLSNECTRFRVPEPCDAVTGLCYIWSLVNLINSPATLAARRELVSRRGSGISRKPYTVSVHTWSEGVSMSQLFRLASPEDYEYIEELNLWELSFDKRPVRSWRSGDRGRKI